MVKIVAGGVGQYQQNNNIKTNIIWGKKEEEHKQKPAEVKPALMDSISESAVGYAKSNNQLHVGQ